jgi:hypothetical protein
LLHRTVLVFCLFPSFPHARTISIVSSLVYFLVLNSIRPNPTLLLSGAMRTDVCHGYHGTVGQGSDPPWLQLRKHTFPLWEVLFTKTSPSLLNTLSSWPLAPLVMRQQRVTSDVTKWRSGAAIIRGLPSR